MTAAKKTRKNPALNRLLLLLAVSLLVLAGLRWRMCHSVKWIVEHGIGSFPPGEWLAPDPFEMFHIIQEAQGDISPLLFTRYRADKSTLARYHLLLAIAARAERRYVEDLIAMVAQESDNGTRAEGYLALGKVGDAAALPFLREKALHDPAGPASRDQAALSAYYISGGIEFFLDKQGKQAGIAALLHDEDREIRRRVASLQRARRIFESEGRQTEYINPITGRRTICRELQCGQLEPPPEGNPSEDSGD